jgi:hypothetical protein
MQLAWMMAQPIADPFAPKQIQCEKPSGLSSDMRGSRNCRQAQAVVALEAVASSSVGGLCSFWFDSACHPAARCSAPEALARLRCNGSWCIVGCSFRFLTVPISRTSYECSAMVLVIARHGRFARWLRTPMHRVCWRVLAAFSNCTSLRALI